MIKVLIIDDSAFMRHMLKRMMETDEEIRAIGTARNGSEGLEKVEKFKPNLITLDITMPGLDGLTVLHEIMTNNPLPVLIISSANKENATIIPKAIQMGAADYLAKNLENAPLDIQNIQKSLVEKIKNITQDKISFNHRQTFTTAKEEGIIKKPKSRIDIIAIGASTGGPYALEYICTHLPKNLPIAVLITIHMPPAFTGPFVERLNNTCQIEIREAKQRNIIKPGTVYIAPGRKHMKVHKESKGAIITLHDHPITIYMPSVNFLFSSVSETYGKKCLAVILTGMGNDGLEGMRELKAANGESIAEHKESCVVYGMPKRVIEAGLADQILPLTKIPQGILNVMNNPKPQPTYL